MIVYKRAVDKWGASHDNDDLINDEDDDDEDDEDDEDDDKSEDVVWGVAGRGKQGNHTMLTCRLFPSSYSQIRSTFNANTNKYNTNTTLIQHKYNVHKTQMQMQIQYKI